MTKNKNVQYPSQTYHLIKDFQIPPVSPAYVGMNRGSKTE